MKKATSAVDESVGKRLAFAGMIMHHVGVLPDSVIEKFSKNEFRPEIPDRLLHAFTLESTDEAHEAAVVPSAAQVQSHPHIEILRETPKPCAKRTADEQVVGMKAMYGMLGWSFIESGLVVPERRKGFDRLLTMADITLTNNRAYDACAASFQSWRYSPDLDTAVPADKDERHPKNGVYAIWVRDRVEADEELKNLSADDVSRQKLKTVTILERELYELVYFMETGQHLDIHNWTLCSGSRNSDGDVPRADWRGGEFRVYWCSRGNRLRCLRARGAVSL